MSSNLRISIIEPPVAKIEKVADRLDSDTRKLIYLYTRIIRQEIEQVREEQRRYNRQYRDSL